MGLWSEMKVHLERHRRYVKEGRTESTILSEYYFCMGLVAAARKLDIMDEKLLSDYESKLYAPYKKA
jgi:hypothetical protein